MNRKIFTVFIIGLLVLSMVAIFVDLPTVKADGIPNHWGYDGTFTTDHDMWNATGSLVLLNGGVYNDNVTIYNMSVALKYIGTQHSYKVKMAVYYPAGGIWYFKAATEEIIVTPTLSYVWYTAQFTTPYNLAIPGLGNYAPVVWSNCTDTDLKIGFNTTLPSADPYVKTINATVYTGNFMNCTDDGAFVINNRAYGIYGTYYNTSYITASNDTNSVISPSGLVNVTDGLDQTFTITANTGYDISKVFVDGVNVGAVSNYTFSTVIANHTISCEAIAETAVSPPIIHVVPFENKTYYFRSDSYNTFNVSGYGFDRDYTNTGQNISNTYAGSGNISFGMRIYLYSDPIVWTEITSGVTSLFTILANYTNYNSNGTYSMPETAVTLGYQALRIVLYENYNGVGWIAIGTYVSPMLITSEIQASTWTFNLYVDNQQYGGNTYTVFRFGNTTYKSSISGIAFAVPTESEIQLWRLTRGDIIGMEIGTYTDLLGGAFYVILLLGLIGVFYFRTGNSSIITFIFILMGGANGLIWILVPTWSIPVVGMFVVLAGAFLVWRFLRTR